MTEDFWRSALETWQAFPRGVQIAVRAAGVFAATYVAARFAGRLVGRRLRAANCVAAFRRPWSPPPASGRSDPLQLTPTRLVTGLVWLTVWGGGLWVFAYMHDSTDVTRELERDVGRVWALLAAVLAAVALVRVPPDALVQVGQSR